MSLAIRKLSEASPKKRNRAALLALLPAKKYDDGRTKQCHRDECDIQKIMARFEKTGTISHLTKFEGVYADFSDFDFHKQTTDLARGETIFNELPAEVRREFGQSPQAFFDYVNDPKNMGKLHEKLPGLAAPGTQLPKTTPPTADEEAAAADPPPPPAPSPETLPA